MPNGNGDDHKKDLLQAAAVLVRWRNNEEGAVESAQLLWDIIERREKERAARAQQQAAEGQEAPLPGQDLRQGPSQSQTSPPFPAPDPKKK
jgi:hypothetical protein